MTATDSPPRSAIQCDLDKSNPADLRERVRAHEGGRPQALGEKRHHLVPVLVRHALHKRQDAVLQLVVLRRGADLALHLDERVRARRGTARLLLQDVLRLLQSSQLLRTRVLRRLVVRRLRHALLLQILKLLRVIRDALVRRLELALGNRLRLLSGRLLRLRLAQVLAANLIELDSFPKMHVNRCVDEQ